VNTIVFPFPNNLALSGPLVTFQFGRFLTIVRFELSISSRDRSRDPTLEREWIGPTDSGPSARPERRGE
jgi:hypothetical protein